jgi:hypothetical protein
MSAPVVPIWVPGKSIHVSVKNIWRRPIEVHYLAPQFDCTMCIPHKSALGTLHAPDEYASGTYMGTEQVYGDVSEKYLDTAKRTGIYMSSFRLYYMHTVRICFRHFAYTR